MVLSLICINFGYMSKEIDIRLLPRQAASLETIREFLLREKGVKASEMRSLKIIRKSIDARQRTVYVNLRIGYSSDANTEQDNLIALYYNNVSDKPSVIVVGAGPGGLFAALRLIELGLKPIVIERGKDVHSRRKDLAEITRQQMVDKESNYCFGEGGAGAYSDGKLYTRSKKRGNVERILNIFFQHGANADILYEAHPHIGSDKLPRVIENMRNTIIEHGGEVHFSTKMTNVIIQDNAVCGVETVTADGAEKTFMASAVILATGHSARDVYRMLYSNKVEMEAKGIAVGVRLEHPAELIDRIQYHNKEGRGKYLPSAEYSFVTQIDGRGVYSFCMCPGGCVIPAATDERQIVVNGMSPSSRNMRWSNSGMVVEIHPDDITNYVEKGTDNVLSMMRFQEMVEEQCWQQGNMKQTAPAQRMHDFVNGKLSYDLPASSYAPGLISSPLHFWMPDFVSSRLRKGFSRFGQMSRGFLTNEAVVIGIETRTSSPIRILRNADDFSHVRIQGLFPCGEGAGYAGGIVSAAIDGEKCAEAAATSLK